VCLGAQSATAHCRARLARRRGAALSPGSLSLLVAAFTDHKERTQALGIWSGISGLALAAGPLVGGVLIRVSNWPAIFFVNLPIGALVFILGWRILAESRNPNARRLDLPGQVLAIAGLASLTYALIEGESAGWTSPLILSLFASAATFLIAFLVVEARVREPVLPLQLFKSVTFSTANAAAAVVGFALIGTVFFVTQYFQSVQGYSPLDAGLRSMLEESIPLLNRMPPTLLHNDTDPSNVLVRETQDGWQCVAWLDWEYAWVGDPTWDVAHLQASRHQSEPLPEAFWEGYGSPPQEPERSLYEMHILLWRANDYLGRETTLPAYATTMRYANQLNAAAQRIKRFLL
jgi:hypothetical protein